MTKEKLEEPCVKVKILHLFVIKNSQTFTKTGIE